MRRPLLRLAGTLRPVRAGYQISPALIWAQVGLFVVTVPLTVLLAPVLAPAGLAWLPYVAAPAVLLGPPLLYLLVTFASVAWHASGAGRPVLSVSDGEVRARLRGVWAGDADDQDWWDVRLPIRDLTAVRVEQHLPFAPVLVLDLPAPLADALLAAEPTRVLAAQWQRQTSSPAAWQVGLFEGRLTRRRRLRALLDALQPEDPS
ncbi:hypothetical protein [Catenuloplanes japonicus]|uniref:hypothetical protein n=1 Tax=Catenuloplanes japonicus TaxID=33876 RepID=UPI0012F77B89|nr:hypothetical protein [Catenuloplanes japonicus]